MIAFDKQRLSEKNMSDAQKPVIIELDAIPWSSHPTILGIEIRMFQNKNSFSPSDIVIARIETRSEIPWHVHESESEIAYILQGTAKLYSALANPAESPVITENDFTEGIASIIPPGLWHRVINTGDRTVLILAFHTP